MSQYVVKIGMLYVTRDGGASARQCDAMRIDVPTVSGALDMRVAPRIVKLTPRHEALSRGLDKMPLNED